jgi:hypothetical protein
MIKYDKICKNVLNYIMPKYAKCIKAVQNLIMMDSFYNFSSMFGTHTIYYYFSSF